MTDGSPLPDCGLFILDLEKQAAQQIPERLTSAQPDDSSLVRSGATSAAIDGNIVYLASGPGIYAFTPGFELIGSWQNRWLQGAMSLSVFERTLFVASRGYDTVLGFNLDQQEFHWALHVDKAERGFTGRVYDPRLDDVDGPLLLDKMALTNVVATKAGMFISGENTEGLLRFDGELVTMATTLPEGARDARPFRNGIVLNDIAGGALRYASRAGDEDRAVKIPEGRHASGGLCVLSDRLVAGGAAPATLAVHDLKDSRTVLEVQLGTNPAHHISSITPWPFD